jgi:hypothetical protein
MIKEMLKKKIIEAIKEEKRNGRRALNPVWSGLNAYLRKRFNIDPVELYKEMEQEGLIRIRPMRNKKGQGYVLLYLSEDLKNNDQKIIERWEKFFQNQKK